MGTLRDFILRLIGLETEESRLGDSYNSKQSSQTSNCLEKQLYRQLRQAKQLPLPSVEDVEVLDKINIENPKMRSLNNFSSQREMTN
jgi:DNA helicase IV